MAPSGVLQCQEGNTWLLLHKSVCSWVLIEVASLDGQPSPSVKNNVVVLLSWPCWRRPAKIDHKFICACARQGQSCTVDISTPERRMLFYDSCFDQSASKYATVLIIFVWREPNWGLYMVNGLHSYRAFPAPRHLKLVRTKWDEHRVTQSVWDNESPWLNSCWGGHVAWQEDSMGNALKAAELSQSQHQHTVRLFHL